MIHFFISNIGIGLFVLCFSSQPLFAKKIIKHKLSDNLLTSKQLLALKPVDQIKYAIFLYHFTAAIEMLERKSKVPMIGDLSSPQKFNSYVYLSQLLEPEAYAKQAMPKSPVAWGNLKSQSQLNNSNTSNLSRNDVTDISAAYNQYLQDAKQNIVDSKLQPMKEACIDKYGIPYNNNTFDKQGNLIDAKTLKPCPPEPKPCTDKWGNPYDNKVVGDKFDYATGEPCVAHVEPKPCSTKFESPYNNKVGTKGLEFATGEPCKNQPVSVRNRKCENIGGGPDCSDSNTKNNQDAKVTITNSSSSVVQKNTNSQQSLNEPTRFNNLAEPNSKINAGRLDPYTLDPKDISAIRPSSNEETQNSGNHLSDEVIISKSQLTEGTCIFGMWISKYKQMADGSYKCTRPEASKDLDCKKKNGVPAFRCNTFGFSKFLKNTELPEESCIQLYSDNGLKDLTERCVKASEWIGTSLHAMNPSDYNTFINGFKNQLDQFEQSRIGNGKMTFSEYCKAHLSLADSKFQKTECTVLTKLINDFKGFKNSYEDQFSETANPEILKDDSTQ